MKVYISQVMRDLSERERIKNIVRSRLTSPDVEFIDSYLLDYNPDKGNIPLKYLAKSIDLLADADLVAFGKGWEEERGCIIEHMCAVKYGIKIIYIDY